MLDLLNSLYLQAGQPYSDVPTWLVVFIFVIYFIGFTVRGVLGFGAVAPIVIITSLLMEPHHAVLLALVASTLPQLQMLPQGLKDGDRAIAWPVLGAMMAGIPFGVWVFSHMGTDWFLLVLGCVISILIILDMGRVWDRVLANVDVRSVKLAMGLSVVAGFVNGLAGAGGVISIAVYLKQACRDHVSLRGTLILIGTLLMNWRLVVTLTAGLISLKIAAEAMLLLPVVYVGVWIGTNYFRTVDGARYTRWVQWVILLSAAGLIFKGVTRLL